MVIPPLAARFEIGCKGKGERGNEEENGEINLVRR